jgi:hypothetical protein
MHVRGEIFVEPTPKEALARHAEDEYKKAADRKKRHLEVAGFWVLTVYAGLTAWLAISSQISATAAKTANANALQSGRPWLGAQFQVTDFALGKTPTYTISYVNTGGRPAIVTAAFNHAGLYENFPANPDKEYGPSPGGVNFVVPGQPYIMANPGVHPLTEGQVNEINHGPRTLWVFGKVEYTDPRTGDLYWTHICLRYLPAFADAQNSGFRNCHQYNDAK